jgi:hypothetical protein
MPTADDIEAAMNPEIVRNIWRFLKHHEALTPALEKACQERIAKLQPPTAERLAEPDSEGVYDAEVVEDPAADGDADAVWQQIVTVGGQNGMTTSELTEGFAAYAGVSAATATAAQLTGYLEHLRAGVPA